MSASKKQEEARRGSLRSLEVGAKIRIMSVQSNSAGRLIQGKTSIININSLYLIFIIARFVDFKGDLKGNIGLHGKGNGGKMLNFADALDLQQQTETEI